MAPLSLKKKLVSAFFIGTGTAVTFASQSIYNEEEKFYKKFVMPVFHKLDPELAHNLSIFLLKMGLTPQTKFVDCPCRLGSKIQHLFFKNPIGMAAGYDKNGEVLKSLDKMGFGFVEIGSVTPEPQLGNKKPRVFRLKEDSAIINRYGFNSDGHDAVYERLKRLKRDDFDCVLGINLGKNKDSVDASSDYTKGIRKFGELADYFVINVSSPNTAGLRDLQKKENLKILLTNVIEANVNLPRDPKPLLFLKLSPDLTQQEKEDVADVLKNLKIPVDGIIISNTTIQRDFDLRSKYSTEQAGGLSGKPIKNISTQMIKDMRKLTGESLPIIGVGGVFDAEDVVEKMKAGANLVQIYTSFIYEGPPVVRKIKSQLIEILKSKNIKNVSMLINYKE